MALQRFVPPTVLKADDVVRSDRLVDRHRRLMLLGLRRRLCHIPEGVVNARDQLWYLRRLNVVLGNVSRDNLGAEADQVGRLFVLHRFSPVAALTCRNPEALNRMLSLWRIRGITISGRP